MIIGTAEITIKIPWSQSLKDKRMVSRSIMTKVKNKFNVSISEIEHQDNHKLLVIGIACVSNNTNHANSMIDGVVNFMYENIDGEISDISIEII